jgi:hypothetical protein
MKLKGHQQRLTIYIGESDRLDVEVVKYVGRVGRPR